MDSLPFALVPLPYTAEALECQRHTPQDLEHIQILKRHEPNLNFTLLVVSLQPRSYKNKAIFVYFIFAIKKL
jgi:hypothetical protein